MRSVSFFLFRGVGVALAVLLGLLVMVATAETVAWALFEVSWAETSEISGVLLVWFGLLGAAYGIRARVHLGVELLTRRLPEGPRTVLERLSALLVATFGVLLLIYGAKLATSVTNTLPATGWSASVQYFPAVVCGALIAFFALEETIYGPATRAKVPAQAEAES